MAPHYSHRGHQQRQGNAADRDAAAANSAGAQVVNAHFGLQGQTARKGMLAYCQKPKGMSTGDYFLAIYVLLSRATKSDDLPLVGMPARRLFEKGLLALPVLQQRMKALEDRAAQDRAAAEGIMKWPKPQHLDDAFAAAANHEP